jgi:hypothetical protein
MTVAKRVRAGRHDLIPPPAADTPRILLYDIETAPALVWVWNQWQTNVIATEHDWYMLCFCYRWLGQDATGFVSIFQTPGFQPDSYDDRLVAEKLAALFDLADVTVAHNGDKFDRRKANARFLYHGIDPPSPYQTVDTKKESARYFANYSNALTELGRLLGIGQKHEHSGFSLWRKCMAGDPEAWSTMEEYNRQDIELLEGLYLRLLPWIGTPGAGTGVNLGLWTPEVETCPKCGGHRLEHRGRHRTRFSVYQTLHCLECGGWSRAPFREKGHATAV